MKGIFTISLDFELHWGGFEKWPLAIQNSKFKIQSSEGYNQYFLNTRKVIPQMLSLFEKHEVHVTWAGVGMLMHSTKKELLANFPSLKPSYQHTELSAYHFIEQNVIGEDESEDPFHFADSLIKQILNTPNQELGSHTFAHFYCNEEGQTLEQFRADLLAAQKAATRFGVSLRSLVFPRNQFNDEYLKVCHECGFGSVRSNPSDWFWKIDTREESFLKRFSRGADAYIGGLGKKNSFPLSAVEVREGLPVCIPASRLLRSYRAKEGFLNQWKIDRIKNEMTAAAKQNEVYHLWWHPHNFGNESQQNLNGLNQILHHFDSLKKQYGMQSLNMGELSNILHIHRKGAEAQSFL